VYLKMAVLRDMTDDGITCEDPEQVGRRKYIAMSQLHHPQQPQHQQRPLSRVPIRSPRGASCRGQRQ
jgi:hypothetical protein